MRIVIDMQGAQAESRYRGIGRYSMALAQAIVRNRGEHEVVLALNGNLSDSIRPIRQAFAHLLPQDNIRLWFAPGPIRASDSESASRRKVAELIREAFLAELRPDVLLITSLFEGYNDDAVTSIGLFDCTTPVCVSFYDLIPLLNPEHYLTPNPAYEDFYLGKIGYLQKATSLLAISEFTRLEGLAHLNVSTERIVNVSTAIDTCFRAKVISQAEAQGVLERFSLTRPFVLYVGGADGRKNLPNLVNAYARLGDALRSEHQLVIAGKIEEERVGQIRAEAQAAGLAADELVFTGYVSDDQLVLLYTLCKVFIFPSWHEGFGLPPLEAMTCGAAVIAANTSNLPHLIGRDDALFDPHDVVAMAATLEKALRDDAFRAELKAHGLEQAQRFSWDKSALSSLKVFEDLHATRPAAGKLCGQAAVLPEIIRAIACSVPLGIMDAAVQDISKALCHIPTEGLSKQLFVDVSELIQRDAGTGIQRVVRMLLRELAKIELDGFAVRPVYYSLDSCQYQYAPAPVGTAPGCANEPIESHHGDIFVGLDLQPHIAGGQTGALSQMRDGGVSVFFVVYDLLPVQLPHCWPPPVEAVHHAWLRIVSQFDGAVCISRAVAEDLADWQRVHCPDRCEHFQLGWFHLGADFGKPSSLSVLSDDLERTIEKLTRRPTFLTVGTLEPRKCHAQALAAVELLWEQGIDVNLVIAGREGWLVQDLVTKIRLHPERGRRLFWLEGISDEALERVYATASCLLAVSQGEGFGLPLIEAARHALPVIARDIPVFREVAGESAYYFGGDSPEDLKRAIGNWLALLEKGLAPKSEGMTWLTWAKSAHNFWAQIRRMHGAAFYEKQTLPEET